jgi:hypothetical protein
LWAVSGSALRKRLPYEYGCLNMSADTLEKKGGGGIFGMEVNCNIFESSSVVYVECSVARKYSTNTTPRVLHPDFI